MTEDQSLRSASENWSEADGGSLSPSRGPDASDANDNAGHSPEIDSHFSELYQEYAPTLTERLRRAFGNGPPDPSDLCQSAFEKLIQRGDISDISNLKGFLWRTARNLFFNDRKWQAMRSSYDFEVEQIYFPLRGDSSTPENVLSVREELNAINRAFEKMPERRRRAFILHRIEGLSVSEVARRLRIARSPTDRHIRRAMEDIQVALSQLHSGADT